MSYIEGISAEFKKDWKASVLTIIFTVARIIYGWSWFMAGYEKLAWLTNGKLNSAKLIQGLITNIAGPKVTRFDPFDINRLFGWLGHNIFIPMGRLTDILVVILELVIGLLFIFGFRVFWSALIAMFLNLQYIAAGSFNNFGYIWANLAFLGFAKYAELIGIDGYLRYKREKPLV